jgi:hypothetical protein
MLKSVGKSIVVKLLAEHDASKIKRRNMMVIKLKGET